MYGYKCFNKGLTNRYGMQFKVGELYHCLGEISFGNDGNGFHMCQNLEDTIRFFDAMDDEVDICYVEVYGKYAKRDDEYNEYFDMYSYEYLKILKVLTREEILDYALKLNEVRITRFISQYHLNDEEKEKILAKFGCYPSVVDCIDYYQNNDKNAYVRRLKKDEN